MTEPREYSTPVGGMWIRKDRNERTYYYIQVEVGDMKYSFHAFLNKYKTKDTHPNFRVFALDGGQGKPVDLRYRTPRSSTAEQAPYKGQAPGSSPGGASGYEVNAPPDEWGDKEVSDGEPMEDDGVLPEETEEDDDIPF